MDLPQLYRQMLRARLFEFAVKDLWEQGRISAEMHLGTGEEAIAAGVVTHLRDGDGLAVTHRSSPPFIVRGVPLVPILRELLGKDDGLCHGRGGHMHLHSKPHLAAASGIVGASVPTAAGFALAATRLRRGAVGLAFTGTGAMNAGMVLETLNLAEVWDLPLVVVCVDNDWAITTPSDALVAGSLVERAEAFGWRSETVDGRHVERVHATAGHLIEHARGGEGPAFLLAPSPRLDGHHLGDALMRTARHPIREGSSTMRQLISTVIRGPGEP
ncbi:MAG: thiamine pyrophosphate-dependent dehydrogenase E1 component subunit alpha, partial [Actinomycetota bacterium]|nr:thiamine pyrophosphate-dependent dehydrogenase E1 component subunit alpha [Actinomycetota bacterium]